MHIWDVWEQPFPEVSPQILLEIFQIDLPGARNREAAALQAHKEILLFQRWLKLLSPAECRICYADGIACMTKHNNREGRRRVITQNSTAEGPADRGIFIYGHFVYPAVPFPTAMGSTVS